MKGFGLMGRFVLDDFFSPIPIFIMPRSCSNGVRMRMESVVIIGYGRWGKALGAVLQENKVQVHGLDVDSTTDDWDLAFQRTPWVLLVTPFHAMATTLERLKAYRVKGIINASKGIDQKTLLTFTDLARKLVRARTATLSGPTFADEVLQKKPTACVIASRDVALGRRLAQLFSTPRFRAYHSGDPKGVEVCGAIKNVLAIACGISDGMNLGFNARAALLTRGLIEMETLTKALGGRASTVHGLAGVGDLWLTATGDLSRNRQLGLQLAKGIPVRNALQNLPGPAEGYYTVAQVFLIGKKKKLSLPICDEIYRICFEGKSALAALEDLMRRPLRSERQRSDSKSKPRR